MKRYIPVRIIFSCPKKAQYPILLTVYCLSGYDTCSVSFWIGQKSVFKVMIQSSFLKVKGLNNLGSRPLSKCQKLACTKFVEDLYGKPDYTSLNEIRCINTAKTIHQKTSSNKQQFLSASSMLHLAAYGMERLLLNNKCAPATNRLWL